jgi:hypothetical protein
MPIDIKQSSQFKITELAIITKLGKFDIGSIFDELNIFDSMLMPSISGNIVVRDGIGLSEKLYFDGSDYISINISKSGEGELTNFKRTFRIYKQTDRKNINQSSEMYVLHFVSEEFIYSLQQKINQSFTGTYNESVAVILEKYLKVPPDANKIALLEPTQGIHSFIIPNLSPFDALKWVAFRAVDSANLPNYLFFQNKYGYNFVSLSTLISKATIADINFNPKNLGKNTQIKEETFGAYDVRVISQFNLAENIMDGVYAGKFIGYDILTRQIKEDNISFLDVYSKGQHLNKNPNVTDAKNSDNLNVDAMHNSKVSVYPIASFRKYDAYTKQNDNLASTIIDDTDNYIFQRNAILKNLTQTKLRITLPGNFALTSGFNVLVKYPSRSIVDDSSDPYDKTLYGKYLIIATRHIIKYDKHETVLEVATDSTNRPLISADRVSG